jgi:hypothetical protein
MGMMGMVWMPGKIEMEVLTPVTTLLGLVEIRPWQHPHRVGWREENPPVRDGSW